MASPEKLVAKCVRIAAVVHLFADLRRIRRRRRLKLSSYEGWCHSRRPRVDSLFTIAWKACWVEIDRDLVVAVRTDPARGGSRHGAFLEEVRRWKWHHGSQQAGLGGSAIVSGLAPADAGERVVTGIRSTLIPGLRRIPPPQLRRCLPRLKKATMDHIAYGNPHRDDLRIFIVSTRDGCLMSHWASFAAR